jgi:hypothetical protein
MREAVFAVRSRTTWKGSARRRGIARATRAVKPTLPRSIPRPRSSGRNFGGCRARTCSARSSPLRASIVSSAVPVEVNSSRAEMEVRPSRFALPRSTKIPSKRRRRMSGSQAKCPGLPMEVRSLPSKAGTRVLREIVTTPSRRADAFGKLRLSVAPARVER